MSKVTAVPDPLRLSDELEVLVVSGLYAVLLPGLPEAFPLVVAAAALIPPPFPAVRAVVVLVSDDETVETVLVVLVLAWQ